LILLLAAVLAALALRTVPAVPRVLTDEMVRFQGVDAWYHQHQVKRVVRGDPDALVFDPGLLAPSGAQVPVAPGFDLLVAGAAQVVGLGRPSERLVEEVTAWAPALLGALVCLPAWWLGRMLAGRGAGLLAAGLLAVQPGPFLDRSMLGFSDHHVAEVLLAALALGLVAAAVRAGEGGSIRWRAWAVGAGVGLGAYLVTWSHGALVVAALTAWALLQVVLDHVRGRSVASVARVWLVVAASALVWVLPAAWFWPQVELSPPALAGSACAVAAAGLLSHVMRRSGLARALFPVALTGLAVAGFFAARWLLPDLVDRVLMEASRLLPSGAGLTVVEVRPLLLPRGGFSLLPLWSVYRTGLLLAAAGFVVLAFAERRRPRGERVLVLVFGTAMLLACMGQGRFGYYLAVPIAVLAGVAAVGVLGLARAEPGAPARRGEVLLFRVIAAVVVALLAFYPLATSAFMSAFADRAPPAEWVEALQWLRENTPAPFPGVTEPAQGDTPAYGVASWWDYGYWILGIGHRPPCANPTQAGSVEMGRFLLETDPEAGLARLAELGAGYVIVDGDLPLWSPSSSGAVAGKVAAVMAWAGVSEGRFVDTLWQPGQDGRLRPQLIYTPEYYRTMMARLYLFGGEAFEPTDSTWIVQVEPVDVPQMGTAERIVSMDRVGSWAEAQAHMETLPAGTGRVVGLDPFRSCVPLEATPGLRRVFDSTGSKITGEGVDLPAVRVFEIVAPEGN